MTGAEMNTRVRTLLDEDSSSGAFWTDSMIYSALNSGQVDLIWKLYRISVESGNVSRLLEPLITTVTEVVTSPPSDGSKEFDLPDDFMAVIQVACEVTSMTGNVIAHRRDKLNILGDELNPIIAPSGIAGNRYYTITGDKVVFDYTLTPGNSSYTIAYLKEPSDIASGVNPTIGLPAHSAICHYAAYLLLMRDESYQPAQAHLSIYEGLSNRL